MKFLERPMYTLLLAVYPILAVSAENVDWAFPAQAILSPVLLSVFVALVGWKSASLLAGRVNRATAALLWVFFWLWYGPFVQALAWLTRAHPVALYDLAFPLWLGVLTLGGVFAERTRFLPRGTRFLNIFTLIFVLFPLFSLVRGPATKAVQWDRQPLPYGSLQSGVSPDIYFFILDGYSSTELLGTLWQHDNHSFEDSLRERNFFIPSESHSNYVHTHLSLASMLNWQHLLTLKKEVGDGRDRSRAYAMIENNRAARFLRTLGYDFVFFRTTFPGTHRNRLADREIPDKPLREKSLILYWFAQTPVTALVQGFCHLKRCEGHRFPYPVEVASDFERKFERLARMPREPGPKFVLAHVLLPHPPYVFRNDCKAREPSWLSSGDRSRWLETRHGYVDQVTCLNHMLLSLIDELLQASDRPPIIVLQADHGQGRIQLDPMVNETIDLENLDWIDIEDRTRVFAAYYLPGIGDTILYDSITPVNVLPTIFNAYFDTNIALEEDATYWSEYRNSYIFTRIDSSYGRK